MESLYQIVEDAKLSAVFVRYVIFVLVSEYDYATKINHVFFNRMKLSIITINCNNKCGLQSTIQSVKNQIYANYEWIVIDGGSVVAGI